MNDLKKVREKAKKPQSYEEAHPILNPQQAILKTLIDRGVFWFFFGIIFVILVAEMILEILGL